MTRSCRFQLKMDPCSSKLTPFSLAFFFSAFLMPNYIINLILNFKNHAWQSNSKAVLFNCSGSHVNFGSGRNGSGHPIVFHFNLLLFSSLFLLLLPHQNVIEVKFLSISFWAIKIYPKSTLCIILCINQV